LKNSEFYNDEYDSYVISFYIPEGKILAAYDKDGEILRTIERFKDVKIPREVIESVARTYPNWSIAKDIYLINYHDAGNITKKYKITLENKGKRIKVKVDPKGNFI